MPLSDTAARNAKGKDRPYKLADAGGLYLLVKPDSAKYWRLKYRLAGKEKLLAIGVYPQTKLAEARQVRDDAKKLIKQGLDPVTHRKQQRHTAQVDAANTFGAVAKEWLEKYGHRWVPIHLQRVRQSLILNIYPDLEHRPIREITAPELLTTMRKVERRGVLDMAQRVLQRCSAVFRYGIAAGHCTNNPATDLRGALKPPKRGNFASLAAVDLPDYLEKLSAYDGKMETRLALRLLLQTFVRTTELRGAEWEEFDLDAAEWLIPAARMKMGVEHIVPLSRQALATLAELRTLTGHSKFLFPNQHNHEKCMSENTMLYALYRMGYHGRATGHGFRTTASTILNEHGFDADAIERQLAHAERNKVRAAYNKAEYLPARHKMMQAWADYLDGIAAGGKVKPLRRAA